MQRECVLAGVPGRRQSLCVAGEAVGQDGGYPVGVGYGDSLSPGRGLGDGGLDQRGGFGLVAPQGREHDRGERGGAASGCLADRIGLRDQRRGRGEVAAPRRGRAQRVQHDRQLVQRPGVPGEPDLPHEHRAPGVIVPQGAGGGLGVPAPPQSLRRGDAWAGEGAHHVPQRRCGGGGPVGDQQGQAVQDQVGRARRIRRRRQRPGGAGDLQQIAGAGQAPGEHRRHPRGQVGLPGQSEVDRLEPPGRLEQQRGSVAAQARDECGLPAQQVRPAGLELIGGVGLYRHEQLENLAERPGLQAGLRRRQRAFGTPGRMSRSRRSWKARPAGPRPAAGWRRPRRSWSARSC